jgi:LPXTG-motif cell wall-anchored protein
LLAALLLAQAGEKGNEAFLGIGVIGWIIIIAIVVAVFYFLRRRPR